MGAAMRNSLLRPPVSSRLGDLQFLMAAFMTTLIAAYIIHPRCQ